MTRPIVSVVMPVYNTDCHYIVSAVNSVLTQSYKDIELIIINDGSTIEAVNVLCRELARHDKRAHLVEQPNSGVSAARNNGIKKTKGDYIMFLDADDVLSRFCIERMLRIAKERTVDLVIARNAVGLGDVPEGTFSAGVGVRDITDEQALSGLLRNTIPTGPFAKLFKAKLVKQTLFDSDYHIAEDLEFNFRAFQLARRICDSDDVVYWYRESENSAMRSQFNMAKRMSGLSAVQKVLDMARLTSSVYIQRMATYRLLMEAVFVLSDTPKGVEYEVIRKECMTIISKYRTHVLLTKDVLATNRLVIFATFIDTRLGIKLFLIKKRIVRRAKAVSARLASSRQESRLRRLKK